MRRIFRYVNGSGALARVGAIKEPAFEFSGVDDLFHQALEHEVHVSEQIDALASVAFEAKDYATFQFLQWFVTEQWVMQIGGAAAECERSSTAQFAEQILGRFVDQEIGSMTDAPSKATAD